jgi:hypothetical protein
VSYVPLVATLSNFRPAPPPAHASADLHAAYDRACGEGDALRATVADHITALGGVVVGQWNAFVTHCVVRDTVTCSRKVVQCVLAGCHIVTSSFIAALRDAAQLPRKSLPLERHHIPANPAAAFLAASGGAAGGSAAPARPGTATASLLDAWQGADMEAHGDRAACLRPLVIAFLTRDGAEPGSEGVSGGEGGGG